MKSSDIKKYAEKNNLKIEEHFASTFIRDMNFTFDNTPSDYLIGIELKQHVWYWFNSWKVNGYECELDFSHRYNQVNGATQKSYIKGREAEKTIMKE